MFKIEIKKFKRAQGLKRRATALRNRGDFAGAVATLDQAADLLKDLRDHPDAHEAGERDVRAELADTYGMKGGVFRRAGDLAKALSAYEQGREVEAVDRQSTYNLSNVITLSVTQKGQSPKEPGLRAALEEAIEHLQTETAGPRRDEWWAWADLAEFYLLQNEPEKARASYLEGKNHAGPTSEEIKRHVTTLEELAERTSSEPEIAAAIRSAIKELMP